ncbi:ABC transporter permease [Actinomadura madurae]|uniref:ABC transporter permease n=1 Tax=Actinomadura madurae TaxID=1993 RepID=UPI00202602B3|nr:ABC transporter permease [Actinomadura madurae]MCP9947814.1 ABC transporter permease [Actinomadura madurae]MCP9977059.1 ABC transporter permease [Actinomadura madurae]MCQ0011435.1 ABC transporter permease [Actinomadura madurae]URM93478.1 ABC transporter permease [Actinomadura madurae]URN04204.1 ABC transporter permease [Actinomadura madurae]
MTTATTEPAAGAKAHPRPGFGRLLLAEWTKIRTVRSTLWSLILLVILDLGFTALFVGLTVAQWDDMQPGDRAQVTADPVSMILGSGFFLSQLTVCVLGVLVIASEYSTGMIRASLLAVPRRLPMLWAKALVFSLVVLVLGIAVSFVSFFIGAAFLGSKVEVSLGDEGVLRAVIGGGLYLAMLGLFALAIGAIVRHSAGGITGVIGFVLVLAPLAALLPGSIGEHVHAYLPSEAGTLIAKAHQGPDDLLTPWQGYGVFTLWTVALLALAAFLLKRRDA